MAEKIKISCPNCSQLFIPPSSKVKRNLPLFLECGHSMCENCIKNIVKFAEPIECKVCHRDMLVQAEQRTLLEQKQIEIYQLFPINYFAMGELETKLQTHSDLNACTDNDDVFVDLQSILNEGDNSKAVCLECKCPSTKMCQQCATVLCDTCFAKSHKNFVIFKNHVLQNIEATVSPITCKIHKGKPLDYFCDDCKKASCMDCLVVGGEKSCKNHNIVAMEEVNDTFVEELGATVPKVDETFRRLTKTAYDIGHLLYNMENETGSASELTQIIASIEQHFSKLLYGIQKHKEEVIGIVTKLNTKEKESLRTAKADVTNAIRKAKKVMDLVKMSTNPKVMKQINLAVLLDEAKEVVESPWFLKKDDSKKDCLKVEVNEDLCGLTSDFIHLEGNANASFKLCSTAELGADVVIPPPPPAAVFAPVLPKDVRQVKGKNKAKSASKAKEESQNPPSYFEHAPNYRSKSGSVSSLNSAGSDSHNKQNRQNERYNRPVVHQVQPFEESQPPKQLREGSQELIYISHIVDPHNFYVQRACHQSLVKDLLKEFRNAVSLPKPSINHVTEGKTYLAFNKADHMWQRCRVIRTDKENPDQTLYHVFYFDFGSTEIVNVDKLRLLPQARLHSPNPLAINCSLANCVPKTGAWTSDDSFLIQKIIDNKQAVIHVRNVQSPSIYSMIFSVDVTTYEDGISLAHALVFHERAKMPNPKLKYPPISGIRDKVKIFFSNDDYKHKAVEEVCITYIVSPDKFFVRKKHQQAVYEQLSLELEQELSMGVNTGTIYYPEVGMACCVHVEGAARAAGGWARGVVAALPGRARVELVLVDSGQPLLVHWAALRHMHPKFARLKALGTECYLAGVTPLNKKWSPGSVALMHNYADKYLELRVEDNRYRSSIGVTLLDNSDEENVVCVNQEMIKYKFAISFGMFLFNKPTEEQVIVKKSPLDKPPQRPKTDQVQILKQNAPQKMKEQDLEAKDKGPLRLEAAVLQYQSPSLIYVSLVHQQKSFNELFESMQNYYCKNKLIRKPEWQVGDRCCTICIQSQTWRRAVIVEIEGENAKVFYSDFATVETVPIKELVELTTEFSSIGDAAIKCHLSEIMPAVGKEWPSITKEYLKELLDSYNRVFITKLGNFKDKSMPIQIWVYHTIQGSALEPNTSEWRCLNEKIIEQGLAVPDKTREVTKIEVKPDGEDEMLSFLNLTGNVRDWLQLEPLPTKPLLPQPESPTSSTHEDVEEKYDDNSFAASNVMFISDWLSPEPIATKEFTAMPTYIDNAGVIYLHDVSQQGTLELIHKALDVRFKNPDPKAKYQKWVVGEPCVAKYFLDKRFYRARILDVDQEASSCIVHYIDYGNEENCSFVDLRKSIPLHKIPTQAHKCILGGIRPVGEHWDRQTLDYIHKSIVEKRCSIKVIGHEVDGITPIELEFETIKYNDHLVDFEMATYTDGRKAVVQKFKPTARNSRKNTVVAPAAVSEPDYIVEEDSDASTMHEAFDPSSRLRDWNEMMEDDSQSEKILASYPTDLEDEFKCNITVINDFHTLELDIIHDEETAFLYDEMVKDLQLEGGSMPPVNGFFENKACIALFDEDQQWYRAKILEYCESTRRVKVKFVDYGNIDVVALADVREIHSDWTTLEPSSVTVQLHAVKLNPDVDIQVVTQEFAATFLDKGPFNAKVIQKDLIPVVELTNESGEITYQNLIDKEILIKTETA